MKQTPSGALQTRKRARIVSPDPQVAESLHSDESQQGAMPGHGSTPDSLSSSQDLLRSTAALLEELTLRSQAIHKSVESVSRLLPAGDVVEFNVSGKHFAIESGCLAQYPESVLFWLAVERKRLLEENARTQARAAQSRHQRANSVSNSGAAASMESPSHSFVLGDSAGRSLPQAPRQQPQYLVQFGGKVPLDSENRILLDRDPTLFRFVLLHLQGYSGAAFDKAVISNGDPRFVSLVFDEISLFMIDQFYRVPDGSGRSKPRYTSGTVPELKVGDDPGSRCQFLFSGLGAGGVGNRLDNRGTNMATSLGPWIKTGCLQMDFTVRNEGMFMIGLISQAADLMTTPDFKEVPGCVALSSEGTCFISRVPPVMPQRVEVGTAWQERGVLVLEVNMDKKFVRWMKQDLGVIAVAPIDVEEVKVAVMLRRGTIDMNAVRYRSADTVVEYQAPSA
jgi:hypothetical protein